MENNAYLDNKEIEVEKEKEIINYIYNNTETETLEDVKSKEIKSNIKSKNKNNPPKKTRIVKFKEKNSDKGTDFKNAKKIRINKRH